MAALNVHTVKARSLRKTRRARKIVLQTEQLVVRDDAGGGQRAIFFKERVVVGDDGRGRAVGLGIPPRVRRLQDEQWRLVPRLHCRLPDALGQAAKVVQIVGRQEGLPRIGAPLPPHGAGLEPDQRRTAARKPIVAAQRQLARCAV